MIHDALSIYAVDEARLAGLEPDVIVTQDLCEVCAVSLEDVRAAVARFAHREQVRIVSLRPTRLKDVLGDIERVAGAIGRDARGTAVRAELQERIDAIARRAAPASTRPRVVSLEWIDPLMLGGTWMPELIELAGGVAGGRHGRSTGEGGAAADACATRTGCRRREAVRLLVERTLRSDDIIERSVARPWHRPRGST